MTNLPPINPGDGKPGGNPDGEIAVLTSEMRGLNRRMDDFMEDQKIILSTVAIHGSQIAVLESLTENCPMKSGNPSPLVDFEGRLRVLEDFKKQAGKQLFRYQGVVIAIAQTLALAAWMQWLSSRGGP